MLLDPHPLTKERAVTAMFYLPSPGLVHAQEQQEDLGVDTLALGFLPAKCANQEKLNNVFEQMFFKFFFAQSFLSAYLVCSSQVREEIWSLHCSSCRIRPRIFLHILHPI